VSGAPLASVIVPTHDRSASLVRLLGALAAQTEPAHQFEVVVVADGCHDDTAAVVAAYGSPFPLRLLEQPASGAAAARNRGAAEATGRTLIFLDDDMEPAPGLVAAYCRALGDSADCVALGPPIPVLEEPLDLFRMLLRLWWAGFIDRVSRPGHRFGYQNMLSGNFAVPASLFRRTGGFDAELRCREDFELGARLVASGARFAWVAEASARHHELTDLDRSLARARAEGRADVRIARRHRDLIPTMELGMREPRDAWRLPRLALTHPTAGATAAGALRRALDGLEWMRARRRWRSLYGELRGFWYWHGVASELEGPGELASLRRAVRPRQAADPAPRPLRVDLRRGLGAAEAMLDEMRPVSARFWYGTEPVGTLEAEPGRERLHGGHVRPALGRELAVPLLIAAAMEHSIGRPPRGEGAPPRWMLAAARA
jgi:glycosyltransferase involved in cell wall biosynthesis